MCVVSMIADHYRDKLPNQFPWAIPTTPMPTGPSRAEFEMLRKEVENLKQLMEAAKAYDERTGQPDCETDEKLDLLKSIARKVGVEL